jgi:hypothetical protein
MAASQVYMQISGGQFVYGVGPTTKSLINLTGCKVGRNGALKQFSGDAAKGPTHTALTNQQRTIMFDGADLGTFFAIPLGIEGTATIVIRDVYNGTGTGALTLTLSNAMPHQSDGGDDHDEFGKGSLAFAGRWADGTTDPMVITQAS